MPDSPDTRVDILKKVAAALMTFDEEIHHGQIVIHIGEGDIELEVNRRFKKVPRVQLARIITQAG